MVNVYVICTPNSDRSEMLLEQLSSDPRVVIHPIKATMITDFTASGTSLMDVDLKLARAIYRRDLLPGEFGCALSHNYVRKLVSQSSFGGIIFEDDARINNLEGLISDSLNFLSQNQGKSRILSFYTGQLIEPKRFRVHSDRHWVRYFGATPYALSYALTPSAAGRLYDSNNPVKFLADWPASASTYYVSDRNYLSHGDASTRSTIEQNGNSRGRLRLLERLQILFGIYFVLSFRKVGNVREFLYWIWYPRFMNYFQKVSNFIR